MCVPSTAATLIGGSVRARVLASAVPSINRKITGHALACTRARACVSQKCGVRARTAIIKRTVPARASTAHIINSHSPLSPTPLGASAARVLLPLMRSCSARACTSIDTPSMIRPGIVQSSITIQICPNHDPTINRDVERGEEVERTCQAVELKILIQMIQQGFLLYDWCGCVIVLCCIRIYDNSEEIVIHRSRIHTHTRSIDSYTNYKQFHTHTHSIIYAEIHKETTSRRACAHMCREAQVCSRTHTLTCAVRRRTQTSHARTHNKTKN